MKIKQANLNNVKDIAIIENNCDYIWHNNKFNALKNSLNLLNNKKETVFILLKNKKPIGYISINIHKNIGKINFFAVKKEYQKKHIGSKLFKYVINFAKKKNCKKILLEVWNKNFNAIKIYTNYNFYIKNIKKNYYPNKDHKLIMQKDLN